MNGEELDKALYDCMGTIWKAYRNAVQSGNFKPYNSCFAELYEKYDDPVIHKFIQSIGMGLVGAADRRIKDAGN